MLNKNSHPITVHCIRPGWKILNHCFRNTKPSVPIKKAKRVNKKASLIKDSKVISKALHDANAIIDESVKDAVNAGISQKKLQKSVKKNLEEHEKKELMKAYKILKVPT